MKGITMGRFDNVAKHIAKKGGYSLEAAKAILAKSSRDASHAAKAKNPNLEKVKGK
jgi:hypothetical protein